MAFHVKDDFKAGAPITQVPASWFNRVGSFLNNLVGGYCVKVEKNERGASTISVDTSKLPAASNKCEAPKTTDTLSSGYDSTPKSDPVGGSFTGGAAGGVGVKIWVLTRAAYHGVETDLFFREITVTSDGRIYAIGEENNTHVVTVVT